MPKSGSPYRRPSESSTALVQRGAFSSVGALSFERKHFETASELCEVPLHWGQLRVFRWSVKPVTLRCRWPARAGLRSRSSFVERWWQLFAGWKDSGWYRRTDAISHTSGNSQFFHPKPASFVYSDTCVTASTFMAKNAKAVAEVIRELHEAYKAKQLNIIVGAGVSHPSGIPTWDDLNKKLLRIFLS
jgi:hypothetical protein